MLINQITEQDKINLQKKFDRFDIMMKAGEPILGFIKEDPTLFAYLHFKDDRLNQFKALPWQDKFLNSKSKRKLLCCARQIGKSTITGILALHKAYFNPGYTILVISRTKDQAMELVYRIRKFLNTSRFTIWDELQAKRMENKREIILRSETRGIESRIIVVPATEAALGYSANIVIGDEAARWEDGDRVFLEVVEPTVTMTKGDIYLLSTPAGRQGYFFRCFNMTDIWDVFHFDYTANPFVTEKEMDQKRKLHTSFSFAINYLAKFAASEDAYFTPNEISQSISPEAGIGWRGEKNIAVGVDFGKVNDKCIIDIGTVINPEKPISEQIVRLLDRRVKPLGTDYSIVLEELKEINKILEPNIFVLDVTSGETPSDILIQSGLAIEPFKFTIQSKISLMNNVKILMQQNRLQIPDADELIEQLQIFQYSISKINQDRLMLHAPEGKHDDEVDALALMCHGLTKNIGYLSTEFISSVPSASVQDESIKSAIRSNDSFLAYLESNRSRTVY